MSYLSISARLTITTGGNIALFDLVGKQLAPRIRNLGKITLYRTGPKAGFEAATHVPLRCSPGDSTRNSL